jgi:aldose 1-epimerase
VTAADADADAARLEAWLDYGRRADRLAAFPFPHRVGIELRIEAAALTVTTVLEAGETGAVPLAFGWHPWLALPGVPRAEWELALPEREAIALDDRGLPTGARAAAEAERAPLGDRVLDDHAGVAEDAVFALAGGGREIAVEWAGGYRYAQVFAPQELDVTCLEPMMAPVAAPSDGDDLRTAEPGEQVRAVFRIRVT